MRVIGGIHGGVPLKAPEGYDTRPTTDRMRETVVNVILTRKDFNLEGLTVLDAFAGSGAVGIELLSRGASFAYFFEPHQRAARILKENIAKVKEQGRSEVHTVQVERLVHLSVPRKIDIAYFDPPYIKKAEEVGQLVEALAAKHFSHNALVVYEHSSKDEAIDIAGFNNVRSRKYGSTLLDVYMKDS